MTPPDHSGLKGLAQTTVCRILLDIPRKGHPNAMPPLRAVEQRILDALIPAYRQGHHDGAESQLRPCFRWASKWLIKSP